MGEITEKLGLDSVIVAREGCVSSALGSEIAILDLASGTYYGLDPVGADIWKIIEKPTRVSDVRDALLERYEVDAARCERDLLNLLSELLARGLVGPVSDEP